MLFEAVELRFPFGSAMRDPAFGGAERLGLQPDGADTSLLAGMHKPARLQRGVPLVVLEDHEFL